MVGGLGRMYWGGLVGLTLLFFLWPGLDLRISGWFYTPESGFFWGGTWWCRAVYRGVEIVTTLLVITLVGMLVLGRFVRSLRNRLPALKILYLLLVLALGPGLLVNAFFKEYWGRARPVTVEAFGGPATFTPPWVISDACQSNCSFVSGHAAMGFYLFAPALLARRRRLMLAGAVTAGMLVGAVRVIQGGHFFSDVVFSGFVVYAAARVLCYLMFERKRR